MAGYNTVRSALRLSAITVAAGTIFGLASSASAQSQAQSRLERAERQLQRAQEELNQARREAGGSDQKTKVECEINCQGCEGQAGGCNDEEQIEANVEMDDDGEGQIIIRQPQGERRIERKIVVQGGGDGEHCPVCGGPMNNKQSKRFELQGFPGGLGGFHAGGPNMQMFKMESPQGGHAEMHAFGKAIVIGPDGQRREFNFGDGEDGAQGHQNQIRRFRTQNEGGDGEGKMRTFRFESGDGDGGVWRMDGPSGRGTTGKIIIVGPDGERQEFDLGGSKGGGGGRGGNDGDGAPHRIRIEKFRDGQGSQAHPAQGRGEQRVIEVRKLSNPL